jgi:acetyl-CoA carboxylase carboxyl transferase subunit beta
MFSFKRPKIKTKLSDRKSFDGWICCHGCKEAIHQTQLQNNLHCCPKCNSHFRLSARQRIALLADRESFVELFTEYKAGDPLAFVDTEPYVDRLKTAQEKTGRDEAVIVGTCHLSNRLIALGVLDFSFMGGSMGSVVGERLTSLIELATERELPLVIVSASGGARMQESIFSLMQMAKTAAALSRLDEARLPYISVLTHPTTGGVTASFATLGDLIIAEPDALIGFAGPRVVEQTTREKLPPKAQKSEFLLEKGMIDCIVNRDELKDKLSLFLELLSPDEPTSSHTKEALKERLEHLIQHGQKTSTHSDRRS